MALGHGRSFAFGCETVQIFQIYASPNTADTRSRSASNSGSSRTDPACGRVVSQAVEVSGTPMSIVYPESWIESSCSITTPLRQRRGQQLPWTAGPIRLPAIGPDLWMHR